MKSRKKFLKILFSLTLVLSTLNFIIPSKTSATNNFKEGKGTESDPYIISSAEELENLRNYCGEEYKETYFKLDVGSKTLDMNGKTIEPICSLSEGNNEEEVFKNAGFATFEVRTPSLLP